MIQRQMDKQFESHDLHCTIAFKNVKVNFVEQFGETVSEKFCRNCQKLKTIVLISAPSLCLASFKSKSVPGISHQD